MSAYFDGVDTYGMVPSQSACVCEFDRVVDGGHRCDLLFELDFIIPISFDPS